MRIQHTITLDVSKQGVQVTIPITRQDRGVHRLMIRLRNNEETVTLGAGDNATLYLTEPEAWEPMAVYTEQSAHAGCLICDLSAAASAVAGVRRGVVMVADAEGNLLHTPELALAVREDLAAESAMVESAPYAAVILAQNMAEASAARAEEAVESAERVLHATEEAAEQIRKEAAAEAARVGEETRQTLLGIQSEITQELDRIPTDEELSDIVSNEFQLHYSTLYDMAEAAKEYTDAELAKATSVRVVSTLPAEGVENKIYLVPTGEGDQSNLYGEYLWINRGSETEPAWGWEMIASRAIDFDLSDYVKKTEHASDTKVGLVKGNTTYGIHVQESDGRMSLVCARTKHMIDAKSSGYTPISPDILDYAVKVGLTTNKEVLTDGEKRSAQSWLGIRTEDIEKRICRMEAAAEGRLYTSETVDTASVAVLSDADSVLPICAIERIPLYPGQTAGSYVLDVTFSDAFRGKMSELIGQLNTAYESTPSGDIRCDVKPLEGQAIVYLPSEEIDSDIYTFPETVSFVPAGDGRFVYETAVTLNPAWMDCWFGTFFGLMEMERDDLIETEFDVVPGVRATLRVTAHSEEAARQAEELLSGATGDIEGRRMEREILPLDVDFSPYPTLYTEPEETLDLQNATDCPSGVCLTVLRRTTP